MVILDHLLAEVALHLVELIDWERVEEIAREKRCTPAQLALAWVMAQGQNVVPIPGTKRRKYLQENVGAVEVALAPEDLERIDEVAPKDAFAGSRYPEAMMNLLKRSQSPK